VNLVGFVFFHQHSRSPSETRNTPHEENMYSIFVHIMFDLASSVGVVVSTWLMSKGWVLADPLVSFGIILMAVSKAAPICVRTGTVFLQTVPITAKDQLERATIGASRLEGVVRLHSEHFWTHAPGIFVGSFCLVVQPHVNEPVIRARAASLFSGLLAHLTIQVEKEDWIGKEFHEDKHSGEKKHDDHHHDHDHDHHDHDHHEH
jgi:Co/Zn/Cd efflux system component